MRDRFRLSLKSYFDRGNQKDSTSPLILKDNVNTLASNVRGKSLQVAQPICLNALRQHSEWTYIHTADVVELSDCFTLYVRETYQYPKGRDLELTLEDVEIMANAASLHDIGKIGISNKIIDKPDVLTTQERTIMEKHVNLGVQILKSIQNAQRVARIVEDSHELWNGTGYPNQKKGKHIDKLARILRVMDQFAAMTRKRPYHEAIDPKTAHTYIFSNKGLLFDPEIVDIFTAFVTDSNIFKVIADRNTA